MCSELLKTNKKTKKRRYPTKCIQPIFGITFPVRRQNKLSHSNFQVYFNLFVIKIIFLWINNYHIFSGWKWGWGGGDCKQLYLFTFFSLWVAMYKHKTVYWHYLTLVEEFYVMLLLQCTDNSCYNKVVLLFLYLFNKLQKSWNFCCHAPSPPPHHDKCYVHKCNFVHLDTFEVIILKILVMFVTLQKSMPKSMFNIIYLVKLQSAFTEVLLSSITHSLWDS